MKVKFYLSYMKLIIMADFILPEDLTNWPPEDDNRGNVEYKSRILRSMEIRKFNRLITQMRWRINEGADICGKYETVYVIGLYDDGVVAELTRPEMQESIDVLEEIIEICEAVIYRMSFIDTGNGHIAILYIESKNNLIKRFPVLDDVDPEEELDELEDLHDIIDD